MTFEKDKNAENRTDTTFSGLPVLSIQPDSPAAKAGLEVGDRILIANGVRIDSIAAYMEARGLNKTVTSVTVQRGRRVFDTEIVFDL